MTCELYEVLLLLRHLLLNQESKLVDVIDQMLDVQIPLELLFANEQQLIHLEWFGKSVELLLFQSSEA